MSTIPPSRRLAQRRPPTGRVLSRTQSSHFVQQGCHVSGFRFPGRIVSQRQSWAAGIGTRVSMRFTPETITFVVPSHRETTPLAKSTRLPNSLRHRAKTRGQRMSWTSPVSSSMVTNTVPSSPRGCCRAMGQPATSTSSPSSASSTATVDSTSEPSVGRTNSMTCPLG